MRQYWTVLAGMVLAGSATVAADKADFSRDQAVYGTATAPAMAIGGDAEYLTSMKKNGRVSLGGKAVVDYTYSRVKAREHGAFLAVNTPGPSLEQDINNLEATYPAIADLANRLKNRLETSDPAAFENLTETFEAWKERHRELWYGPVPGDRRGNRTFHASEWQADTADLNIRVDACDNAYLTMTLDFTDPWNGLYQRDGLLKELYFTMENVAGSCVGFKLGKQEIPFGMDKDVLAIHPYLDGYYNTYLNTYRNGKFQGAGIFDNLWVFGPEIAGHSVKYDHAFAVVPYFQVDKFKFELAMFQSTTNKAGEISELLGGGYYGDFDGRDNYNRSTNDPGFSFAGKMAFSPIEDLELSASAVTRYNRAVKSVFGKDIAKDRMWATSLAFDWNPCFAGKKVNLFGEWQHAWNPEFVRKTSSDDIHAGVSFDVTEAITLYGQYEWLRMREKLTSNKFTQDFHRALVAGKYTFASGIYAELGYQHEWARRAVKANADIFYTAMGWNF